LFAKYGVAGGAAAGAKAQGGIRESFIPRPTSAGGRPAPLSLPADPDDDEEEGEQDENEAGGGLRTSTPPTLHLLLLLCAAV